METANQTLDKWREILEKILQYYADLPYRYGDVITYLIVSRDRNHFMLVQEGWENDRRVHGCVVHAEIRNDKIWIHYDGIEDGITDELVAAGVPKDCIVLAFHPIQVREHTGYAIA
ncbi:FdxN element excision controlling factor protein [Oscillatoriales cyanobacterium USR001]|nr:FdxN element excision controlling factor protein [Oscillatoriales cyanobacterium USR001]